MDAFFYINKPSSITSFQVLREMRNILGIKKIGHTGTLDPLATGGLLVATGNYTKLIPYVEKDTKKYRATIMLDGTSPSYDSDTEVSFLNQEQQKKASENISHDTVEKIFSEHFIGKIKQIPPKYSALKIDGKKALERVKSGENIVMKPRQVEILSYRILSYDYPKLIVELHVSAGTYIRSIAHDLGEILETGGYLCQLTRVAVGSLDISLSTTLDDLSGEKNLNITEIFPEKIHEFQDEQVYKRLSDGQRVRGDFALPQNKDIFLSDGKVIRFVIEHKDGVIHPRKKIIPLP